MKLKLVAASYERFLNEDSFPKSKYQEFLEDQGLPNQEVIDSANKAARIAYHAYMKAARMSWKYVVILSSDEVGKGIKGMPIVEKLITVLTEWETEFKKPQNLPRLRDVLMNEQSFEARKNKYEQDWHVKPFNRGVKPQFTLEEKVMVTEEAMDDVYEFYENMKIILESMAFTEISLDYPLDNFNWGKEKMLQEVEFNPENPEQIGISYVAPSKTIKEFLGFVRQHLQRDLESIHQLIGEYENAKVAI